LQLAQHLAQLGQRFAVAGPVAAALRATARSLGLVGRHRPQEHVRRVPAKQPGRGGGLLGHDDDRVVRFPHSHEGEPYVAVRQHLEGEAVMRRTVRVRFCPRGWLGARERDDLQGLREGDVRENVPLVPGARARARVLGVPVVAGLRVRRVRARRTAGTITPSAVLLTDATWYGVPC